ncbi:hypothetical protein V6N13_087461 [Hibiscus sabdariffa]
MKSIEGIWRRSTPKDESTGIASCNPQRRAHEKSSNGFQGFLFVTDRELGTPSGHHLKKPKLSFYLPGSVDVEDKQLEQWNVKAPPVLSLESQRLDGHAQGNITTMDEAT